MASAPFRPEAIALETKPSPVAASPPANTLGIFVLPRESTAIRPSPEAEFSGRKERSALSPTARIKASAWIISTAFRRVGNLRTAEFLDALKDISFRYATAGGLSVGLDDVIVPREKEGIINTAQKNVDQVESQYQNGIITQGERYNKVIDLWTSASNRVADRLMETLQKSKDGFNSLFMMVDSGARGSREQVRQLAGGDFQVLTEIDPGTWQGAETG